MAYLVTPGTFYVAVIQGAEPERVRRGEQFEPTGAYWVDIEAYSVKPDDHSDFPFAEYATRVRLNSSVRGTVQIVNRSYHIDGYLNDFDVDFFRIDVDRPGTLTVYTIGELDTHGSLWNSNHVIDHGRDERDGHNFQFVETVPYPPHHRNYHSRPVPGTYYVAVTSRPNYAGSYTLHVEFVADGDPPDPSSMRGALRATLLNLSPWQAWVHLYCQKDQIPRADLTTDPCAVTLECGQMAGTPATWTVDVEPKSVFSYKSGTEANLEAALVAAGKTDAEARRRTTCEVFSPDPLEARAFTRIAGELVPVADQPILLDQAAPQRIAILTDLSPPQSWVHLYCRKDRPAPDAAPANPCAVNLECRQEEGDPVSWTVDVAPKTIFSYWPGKTASDGTSDNLSAALMNEGKTEEEARRRTTCEVSSSDPVAVRGYTRLGEGIIPVKN